MSQPQLFLLLVVVFLAALALSLLGVLARPLVWLLIAAVFLVWLILSRPEVGRYLAWLFRRPGRPTRDLSALAASGEATFKQEIINTGGPLKPNHKRLELRDNRLLPKPKPEPRPWPFPPTKKPKIMPADEARRLFSPTLRTRNRNIRDLATDEAQLERYGLPIWKTEENLAAALLMSVKRLRHFSIHRTRDTLPHYVTFAVPKRTGGERQIHAPKRRLKAVLRKLDMLLVRRLPKSEHAHGFVTGRSIATNAAPHVGKSVLVCFDIKDCFPTIHYGRVRGLLIALGYSYPVATTLAVLMTEAPRQRVEAEGKIHHVPVGPRVCVQGAPTSPGLCNAVLLRLDRRLAGLAEKHGFAFTRYADDLTFSGNSAEKIAKLLKLVPRIVAAEGFAVKPEKTRVMRAGRRQAVTGVVVNETRGLSRQERRKLRAALHRQKTAASDADAGERQRLQGRLAYLHMLNPDQAEALGWRRSSKRG